MATDAQHEQGPFGRAERRTSRRKIVALLAALLLLALTLCVIYYYNNSRGTSAPGPILGAGGVVSPPEYLYSISGPGGRDALTQPLGVDVSADDLVYVTDAAAGAVRVYTVEGDYRFSFSEIADGKRTALTTPVYVELNSIGEVFVSDRCHRAVYVFSADGQYLRKVEPADGDEAAVWGPLALAFDEDDNLWVSDVGRSALHQVIEFDREGDEIRRFGGSAQAERVTDVPGRFLFPNGLVVRKGVVYVADSNNQRVQVFNEQGDFDRVINTSGIPRGLDMDDQGRLYVADALAHQADVYRASGERVASFGGPGAGPGQFRFTNDLALDQRGFIYVTDRVNGRVQVWGWPEPQSIVSEISDGPVLWPLLGLLLLLPLLLLLRRRRFVVTEDFLEAMTFAGLIEYMEAGTRWAWTRRRWMWIVPSEMFPRYEGRELGGVSLDALLTAQAHSESDAKDLMERLGVERSTAVLLTVAGRAGTLCTQAPSLAATARASGVDAYDARLFVERFLDKGRAGREHA
jgi:sugar lactone lactonase YvrE